MKKSAASAMRAYRARRRRRCSIMSIEYPNELADALVDEQLLPEWDVENPCALKKAVEKLLRDICITNGYPITGSEEDMVYTDDSDSEIKK